MLEGVWYVLVAGLSVLVAVFYVSNVGGSRGL